jgi:hypothetical protein
MKAIQAIRHLDEFDRRRIRSQFESDLPEDEWRKRILAPLPEPCEIQRAAKNRFPAHPPADAVAANLSLSDLVGK